MSSAPHPRALHAPPDRMKPPDGSHTDIDSFGAQEFAFQLQIAAIAAQCTRGADDAMARGGRVVAVAHDVADGAPRARPPGERSDVAICGDLASGNPPDDCEHLSAKITHVPR